MSEKQRIKDKWFKSLVNSIFSVIDIQNVPETINKNYLLYKLFVDGKCIFFKDKENKLRVQVPAQRGLLDCYFTMNDSLVVNPILGSYELTRENSVIVYSYPASELFDMPALYELITTTAKTLTEIELSIDKAVENTRCIALFACSTDVDVATVRNYMEKVYKEGQSIAAVEKGFIDKIEVNPLYSTAVSSGIIPLVELKQYTLSSFYQQIGLNSVMNMKRAQVQTSEIDAINDTAFFNIENMIENINVGLDNVNDMFGSELKMVKRKNQKIENENVLEEGTDEN